MTRLTRASRTRRHGPAVAQRVAALVLSAALLLPGPVRAQGPKLNVIRDAEIEDLLRDYTRPILRAAKLGGQNVEVVMLGDRSFNAFVADGRRIFVNVGALYDSETPNQLIGVLTAVALVTISILGVVMWLKRKPRGSIGAPPPVAGAGEPSMVVAIVGLGLLLPLFGASLLILVVVDRLVVRACRPATALQS